MQFRYPNCFRKRQTPKDKKIDLIPAILVLTPIKYEIRLL